jgi:hypothetical protein
MLKTPVYGRHERPYTNRLGISRYWRGAFFLRLAFGTRNNL